MSAFSEWVRLRRLEKGLTQKEAAEQLGVGKSMVGMFESGESIPSVASYGRIRTAYGEPPKEVDEWLNGRIGKRKPRTDANDDANPFSAWMKEARATRRLAQRDLAKQIGMNRSGLQMAEAGQSVMSKRNRERLEAVLGKMPEDVRRWLATQDAERSKAHSKLAEEDLSPLGRLLRARRLSLGLSQEEVAERLGRTSENFMQTVEAGSLRLKDKVLEDLAEALELPEVPAEWFEAREEAGQTGLQRNERKAEEVPQLGAEIRRLRKAKGFSRARLASLCGLSVTYLGKVELGGCAASDETLLKIARGIGFEKVPGQWFTLREASGQNLQHTHGGMNDALSPFGAKLRHLRMSCKVTQSELDRRCGMSKGYICRLEYGRDKVTPERLEVILTCLGVKGVPEDWKAAVEASHQWQEPQGLKEGDLEAAGWQARKDRLQAGRSMEAQAEYEGVSVRVIREREVGKLESWRKRMKEKQGS